MSRLRNAAASLLMAGMALVPASCDKAKDAVVAAREKFRGADPGGPAVPGGEVSPELAAQVDTAAEGVRFRRDLPFPVGIDVRTTERTEFLDARIVRNSALGIEKAPLQGTREIIANFRRSGSRLTVGIEKAGQVREKQAEEGKPQPQPTGGPEENDALKRLEGASVDFILTNRGWRLPESKGSVDFNRMVWGKQLQAVLPVLLPAEGILPRTQWFSSTRRWNEGDKLELSGDAMALLAPGKSSGKVILTYEVSEAMEGHPCGRFSVSGDLSLKDHAGIGGETADHEVTFRSGKIWCSLLHPVILREDYEAVVTVSSGSGGATTRLQGGVKVMRSRQWKPAVVSAPAP